MLNNYLQHQEWPHFSECFYKSSQGPGLWATKQPGRELPNEKNPKYYFCLRNIWERERNRSFLHFIQDFKTFLFLTSALLHTLLHIQAILGVCLCREEVDCLLLCGSVCHTTSDRPDYPQGILMSLCFVCTSFPCTILQKVSASKNAGGGGGGQGRTLLKNTLKILSLSHQDSHKCYRHTA